MLAETDQFIHNVFVTAPKRAVMEEIMKENKNFELKAKKVTSTRRFRVFSARTEDNCPKCDHPAPIIDGWCQCGNCGHIWRAGSH